MKTMMRKFIVMFVLVIPMLACTLGTAAVPTPTAAPPPVRIPPTLGLNPVIGIPGTTVTITAAGFPVGARVALTISLISTPSNTPVLMQVIGTGGLQTFPVQLPTTLGTTTIANNTPLVFRLTAETGESADALFMVLGSTAATATPITGGGTGTGTGGGTGGILVITGPPIGSFLSGNAITVTGSGAAANNIVGVQVQDANNTILGSANATIQASPGYVGVWQVTVGFNQPAAQTTGFIAAFTAAGQQSSIPITLAGSGIAQPQPQQTAIQFPTPEGGIAPMVTATKLFQ